MTHVPQRAAGFLRFLSGTLAASIHIISTLTPILLNVLESVSVLRAACGGIYFASRPAEGDRGALVLISRLILGM